MMGFDRIYKNLTNGNENSVERRAINQTEISEFPRFNNSTSLKMLDDITAKVWKVLPIVEIPQTWVLEYCMKYTEISEQIEKASMQCQYGSTDWDCTFIELSV
ncbi:uncharacterized protein LOC143175118 isoform X2 [Nomia melanderi]|uniref:uncharacterized protein LOC143175118 isoform X2 n=1 Tax=Nomia melanderi TaxID=2448451 RepID=UPI003FCD76AC